MPFTQPGFDLVQARFTRRAGAAATQGDVVVNTFVFESDGSSTSRIAIRDALDDFYTFESSGVTSSLRYWMADNLDSLDYYFRAADAAQGTPGEELASVDWTTPPSGINLPPEMAVCASYRAAPPYTARRRGRLFIGPLKAITNDDGVVEADFITAMNFNAQQLVAVGDNIGHRWMIASRAGNTAAPITEGYTNAHFDVQRRRDPSTETRLGRTPAEWGPVLP